MPRATDLVTIAKRHIGQRYVLGAHVPKDNAGWRGPWDCAEFVSWCVYQLTGELYGCNDDSADPSLSDAYTGYWRRDARTIGQMVPIDEAAAMPGAILLRYPPSGVGKGCGHVVISDGDGGTVEAKDTASGVVAAGLARRRWDTGILIPWLDYTARPAPPPPPVPRPGAVLRLGDEGESVRALQRALAAAGLDPGSVDGSFGPHTLAAVRAFQIQHGLVPDGEVGAQTRAALGLG
jgi:hypothetical protein